MKRTEVTYGQLDRALRSLGFTCRDIPGKPPVRVYEHAQTGAEVSLPPYPPEDQVLEYHLVTTRIMLDEHGIADPTAFADSLQTAG